MIKMNYLIASILLSSVSTTFPMKVGTVKLKVREKKALSEELCKAIEEGALVHVERIIRQGIDPDAYLHGLHNIIDEKSSSYAGASNAPLPLLYLTYLVGGTGCVAPLFLAVWRKRTEVVKVLVEQGANVNLQTFEREPLANNSWNTNRSVRSLKPLDVAMIIGDAALVKLLLTSGATATSSVALATVLWGPDLAQYARIQGKTVYTDTLSPFGGRRGRPFWVTGECGFFVNEIIIKSTPGLKALLDEGVDLAALCNPAQAYMDHRLVNAKKVTLLHMVALTQDREQLQVMITYPFFELEFPDRSDSKERLAQIVDKAVIDIILSTDRTMQKEFNFESIANILVSDETLAWDTLSLLVGHLFMQPQTVKEKIKSAFTRKKTIMTCTALQVRRLREILSQQKVLPRPCILALLRNYTIKKLQSIFLLKDCFKNEIRRENYKFLIEADLLRNGEQYGPAIEAAIEARLFLPQPDEEPLLEDRKDRIMIQGRTASIRNAVLYFSEPPQQIYF